MEIQLQVGSLVHIMVQYIIGALCASGHRGLCRLPSGIWLVASVTYATMSHCISGTAIVPFWSPFFCIFFNRALQSCGIAAKRCGNLAEDVRLPSTVSELLDMILCPKVAIS